MKRRFLVVALAAATLCGCEDDEPTDFSQQLCPVVNGGVVDECPEGQFCLQTGNDDEPLHECVRSCSTDDDCDGVLECYDVEDTGRHSCGPPQPVCDPVASADACECGFDGGTQSPIFLVMGTGADCVIVERDRTACYSQTGTCLNSCVAEYYRYDLGDGTALVLRALQGSISDGWVSDGQTEAPISCPTLGTEFPQSDF